MCDMDEEASDEGTPEEPPSSPPHVSKAIVKYYTNKKVKPTSTSLETIFEETEEEVPDGCWKMSRRKFKRSINFSMQPVPKGNWGIKKTRRKGKGKKGRNNNFKRSLKKVSEDVLKEKLAEIEQVEES